MRPSRRTIVAAALAITVLQLSAARPRSSSQRSTVVLLVRHGEKAATGGNDPALSAAGEARAKALADALADANVDAIITTPLQRTRATAAPLAARRRITPIEIGLGGGTAAHAAAVADAIRQRFREQTVLVVGHANTLAPIIAALGGPKLADLCDDQYSTLYTLILPPS